VRIEGVTPILNVSDIEARIAWFGTLGWETDFTWPAGEPKAGFASITSGEQACIFLCRGAQGARDGRTPLFDGDDDTGGVWMSWWVARPAQVDAVHAAAVERGYEASMPPTDEPWGVREFHLRHPDGHTFRVSCGLGNSA
jgi:uncharacterized glyoxalase superfamily protein PhnB